jgi:hypothetical protein
MELKIDKLSHQIVVRENITSHALSFTGRACGISDIVKRRSIRVWDRKGIAVRLYCLKARLARSPIHYLQFISALAAS